MSLMSLPTEVREEIFLYVLHSPPDLASRVAELLASGDEWIEAPDISYTSWTRSEGVLYLNDPKYYQSRISALLRVNRQCYLEMKGLVREYCKSLCSPVDEAERLSATLFGDLWDDEDARTSSQHDDGFPDHHLSPLATVDENSVVFRLNLHLTSQGEWKVLWTDVPLKTRYIHELYITLTNVAQAMATQLRRGAINTRSMLEERVRDESPALGWVLWSILERYLAVGVHEPNVYQVSKESSWSSLEDIYAWRDEVGVVYSIGKVTIDYSPSATWALDTNLDLQPARLQQVERQQSDFEDTVGYAIVDIFNEIPRCLSNIAGLVGYLGKGKCLGYNDLGYIVKKDRRSFDGPVRVSLSSSSSWSESYVANIKRQRKWRQAMQDSRRVHLGLH